MKKCRTIDAELFGTCDIDYTLLEWGVDTGRIVDFKDPYTGEMKKVGVNESNLRVLTNWLERGATIQVFSRSGRRWAAAALDALDLDHENLVVSNKPLFYIDDKPASNWMGEQVYLKHDDPWGKTLSVPKIFVQFNDKSHQPLTPKKGNSNEF